MNKSVGQYLSITPIVFPEPVPALLPSAKQLFIPNLEKVQTLLRTFNTYLNSFLKLSLSNPSSLLLIFINKRASSPTLKSASVSPSTGIFSTSRAITLLGSILAVSFFISKVNSVSYFSDVFELTNLLVGNIFVHLDT